MQFHHFCYSHPCLTPLCLVLQIYTCYTCNLITDLQQLNINTNLGLLEDDLGTCEKILKTPLPFIYIVHLRTILALWLIILPLALIDSLRCACKLFLLCSGLPYRLQLPAHNLVS